VKTAVAESKVQKNERIKKSKKKKACKTDVKKQKTHDQSKTLARSITALTTDHMLMTAVVQVWCTIQQ